MTFEHLDTIASFVAILAGVSLLVTTLTQMASALFALRGANLRWGIETLLKHADPNLAPHASAIAEKVLRHPMISDSTMSGGKSTVFKRWRLASAIRPDELIEVLRVLAEPAASQTAAEQPEPWRAALQQSLESLDRDSAAKLLQVAPEIRKALPDDTAKADQIIAQLTASAECLSANIGQWFDSVMDRVSQRFALHTRLWTVALSALIAFTLHLDALRLLTQLSGDAELRARLISSADVLSQKADEMKLTSTNEPPTTYVAAISQLTNAAGDFQYISKQMRFQLVPDPYPAISSYWEPSWMHFWGTLASAALLSLGAPFWFNMLKNLSNLRPVLARRADQTSEAEGSN